MNYVEHASNVHKTQDMHFLYIISLLDNF